ncbi:hypothetical protein [Nocardioides piscis]|uniref:Uncharacterized protein n=1 Tax=Nocardioides piscis TaxID=2714938 RepID=A0A6G7YCB4_9ACTN|nr:hypothetical protein [Nocardioides piscis]QIK74291.1 hypothetical protein G7071_01395 [Nocardioides piscis]
MRYVDTGSHHDAGWTPTSPLGRWSVAFAAAAVLGVVLSVIGFATGVLESASSFDDDWVVTTLGVAILASGAAGAVTGGVALIRDHDRSRAVMVATLLGAVVLALLLNEVAQGL